ncbi:ABC transporter ATP-binding protein [bacterium]|nr:ABC transporter ATP-binding protein [bacterium]
MIEAHGLTRRFGDTVALDGVGFAVGRGEVVGLLGPNGAGKTTAMRILTCTLPPSAGRASVAGHDVVDASLEVRRRVGFMPEHVPLYPDATVAEHLRFTAELKDVPAADRDDHLEAVMARAGLPEVRDRMVGHLSKGYRQRVGLAQALVGDPEVLILDEPTGGLDPHQIVEIRDLIRSFRGERTVLLSSHILSEVARTCGRVIILDRGRLAAEVDAADLPAASTDGNALEDVFLRLTGGERETDA